MSNKPILLTFQRRYTSSAIEDILLGQSKYIFSEKAYPILSLAERSNTKIMSMYKELSVKSRVRGDFHARFCERVRVKLPRSTRPLFFVPLFNEKLSCETWQRAGRIFSSLEVTKLPRTLPSPIRSLRVVNCVMSTHTTTGRTF